MKMKTKNQDSRLSSKTNTQDQDSVLAASTTTKNCHIEKSHQFIPQVEFLFVGVFLSTWCDGPTDSFCDKFCHSSGSCFLTIFINHDLTTWVIIPDLQYPRFQIISQQQECFIIQHPVLFYSVPSNWNFPSQEFPYKTRKLSVIIQ